MIEFSWSWSGPWWIIPLYFVGLFLLVVGIMLAMALFERWLDR